MKKLSGIGVSSGIATAKIYKLIEEPIIISEEKISEEKIEENIELLKSSIISSEQQINKIKEIAIKNIGKEKAEVFDAHISILKDPEIIDSTINKIKEERYNAAHALKEIATNFISIFEAMDDEYMKERSADIKDVTNRIIKNILKINIKDLSLINEEVIIISHDLTPSETSQLNPKFVKGFLTEIGGRTSHSAIMARTLEIPAIVGIGKEIFSFEEDEKVLIDGAQGEILYKPTQEDIDISKLKAKKIVEQKLELEKYINKKSISKDGFETEVAANIGSPKDIEGVQKFGAEGIGLFRSEFLYMDSQEWPTEEEQFNSYKKVLEALEGKRVVIRTLDIGGDKHLSYYEFPKELNPFLGYRAIRLQLKEKDIFRTQARALLRASAFGKLAINVPMIATIEEFKEVKAFFDNTKKELINEGIKVGEYELGIMVEVPSVVEIADIFAKHADFFSIGTNDLIQYTFAADRMSEHVSYLYQPFNPAILRKIKKVIDASHEVKKWTAICGEAASEPMLTPIFIGMGLDEFSMSATAVPSIRRLISLIDKSKAEELVNKVLFLETQNEVKEAIQKFFKDNNIEVF